MSTLTFIHYKDDGPRGICGQAMSVTSPRDQLFVCTGRKARKLIDQVESGMFRGRKNPRIVEVWEMDVEWFRCFSDYSDPVIDASKLLKRLFRKKKATHDAP